MAPVVAGVPTRKEFGRGRVVYFPGIEFDGPLPPAEPYFQHWPSSFGNVRRTGRSWWMLFPGRRRAIIPLQVVRPRFSGE